MAKAKKKKVEIEENEFLRGLIDEVKAIDDDSRIELGEDSDSIDDILQPGVKDEDEAPKIKGILDLGQDSVVVQHSEPQIPTAFINLGQAIKKEEPPPRIPSSKPSSANEKTIATPEPATATAAIPQGSQSDRTIAVEGARGGHNRPVLQEKVATGALKGTRSGQVYTSLDASLAQAETLKIAQDRIKELELEVDRLRQENDDLASASDVVSKRMEELQVRVMRVEKEKTNLAEQSKNELLILKGQLSNKDTQLSKAKTKIEDLDLRIKSDFRKIRVRERELENRLELVRAEKQALMRSKDETILDLQRKLDHFKSELDLYRSKVQDLNKSMEEQQEQMRKTVRALRVALSNLEHEEATEAVQTGEAEVSAEKSDDLKKAE